MMENTQNFWWKEGFYDYPVEGGAEISEERWRKLLDGQSAGYRIVTGEDGYPTLIENGPQTLDEWREAKLNEIASFDRSEQVNRFYMGETPTWFDQATRSGLRDSLDAEEEAGKTTTVLWLGSEPSRPVEMPIAEVRRMLADIEVYAKAVFDTTQRHRAKVYTLTTIEEVKACDHTVGYPEKIRFEAGGESQK